MNEKAVMILANPGPLRDGLHALIFAMPQIESITEASDLQLTPGTSSEHHPSVVILDAELTRGNVPSVMQLVKARWSQARYIVLANDVREQQEAESAGADAALLKGVPPSSITEAVSRLLAEQVSILHS
jgi:DNA-binding NarL/FixJ family response regulator